jgi:hypothetical protein
MSDASNWGGAQLNQMFKAASVRKIRYMILNRFSCWIQVSHDHCDRSTASPSAML